MKDFQRRYVIDNSQALRALRQLDQENQKLSRRSRQEYRQTGVEADTMFQRMGRSAQRWLGGIAVAAVTALVAALAAARTKTAEFRRDLAEISTLSDGSAVSMKRLERGIIDIAARVGGGSFTQFTKANKSKHIVALAL